TTLLAMVDSSVGGKTAVNTPYGKNLIGAFWQPQLVVMDTLTLTSLPQELVINGLIEALKVFLTSDAKSFYYANRYLNQILAADKAKLQSVIKRAVKIKAEIVRTDEKEENLRMILNFGHTIGHALEKLSNYTILHGYAVALGILVESKMAVLAGHLSLTNYTIIAELMRKLGISGARLTQFNINAVVDATLGDKKNKAGQVYCVLLTNIGTVYLDQGQKVATPVSEELIHTALTELINSNTSETALVINN
ncbi:MAG: 3-dehydroquinate synthase family protein, partial [Burkholderiales bacterium]